MAANVENCEIISAILNEFSEASRQTINFNKQSINFSTNVPQYVELAVVGKLHIQEANDPGTFILG